ncbi:hypothetical protein GTA51_00330 [Desulfovibrio aerotolerans]|uniref:Uncharacterized protein n=1 Tax=Solidesulfovibrio aerotolerans TaxID=295255 RepID=A0A7C9ITP0_9BACT|nr:hypothetical protein [Solidesulfovibrio aerotolerans]MYL81583.1 hypothetical protein [Solidesulfovibrio aerotolerans]
MSQSDTARQSGEARNGRRRLPGPAVRGGQGAPMPALPALPMAQPAPGRHHLVTTALPALGPDLKIAVYAAGNCVIRVMEHGDGLVIRLRGLPDEAGVAALGDCLVEALDRGIASIRIAVATRGERLPLAVEALLESLARLAASQGGRPGLCITGEEPAASHLARAVGRGLARRGRKRRPAQGQP